MALAQAPRPVADALGELRGIKQHEHAAESVVRGDAARQLQEGAPPVEPGLAKSLELGEVLVDPADPKAVRRFDKQREGRKTSNTEWQNPHDPEAKVGRTKDGACDMIYKPEHITDLESGVIVGAAVRPGDAADNDASLCERVMESIGTLREVAPEVPLEKLGAELCADEGYFAIEQIAELQECGVRSVIADPLATRRNPRPSQP